MTPRDPVREQLQRRADDAGQRVEAAKQGLIRCLAGGLGWHVERIRRYEADFQRARADLDLAVETLRTLDEMDREIGGAP